MAVKLGTKTVTGLYLGSTPVGNKYLGNAAISGAVRLGSEMVVNGGFDTDTVWTKGAGWTIGSGISTKTATNTSTLTQTIAFVAGKKYQITYDVLSISGSTVSMRLSGTTVVTGTARSTPGTYTQILVANATSVGIQFAGTAALAVTLDNVSIKEVL